MAREVGELAAAPVPPMPAVEAATRLASGQPVIADERGVRLARETED
jgi:hypothetical protein